MPVNAGSIHLLVQFFISPDVEPLGEFDCKVMFTTKKRALSDKYEAGLSVLHHRQMWPESAYLLQLTHTTALIKYLLPQMRMGKVYSQMAAQNECPVDVCQLHLTLSPRTSQGSCTSLYIDKTFETTNVIGQCTFIDRGTDYGTSSSVVAPSIIVPHCFRVIVREASSLFNSALN